MRDVKYTYLMPSEGVAAIRISDNNDVIFHHNYKNRENLITGPIADKLYAYEQLGYSPAELKKIIERHRINKAWSLYMNSTYGTLTKPISVSRVLLEELRSDYFEANRVAMMDQYLKSNKKQAQHMEIKKVIFNDPATIVFWADGTKTVVKATNEKFDPEKGLAMAISKRALGDKGNYFEVFKKHLKGDNK